MYSKTHIGFTLSSDENGLKIRILMKYTMAYICQLIILSLPESQNFLKRYIFSIAF